ncbi:MAG: hypothetical protein JW955_17305 [Sedimentisphaerales bacterium]|nr:hypothetical protein [Sedimentisphaerales bacterium]
MIYIPKGEENEPKAYEKNWAKMYENKWRRLTDTLADLQAGIIEAKAIWDRGFPMVTKDLFICISELHSHLNDSVQSKLDEHYERLYRNGENREVLYARLGSPEKDEFGQRIKAAVWTMATNLEPTRYQKLEV